MVRVIVGWKPILHEYIATGHEDRVRRRWPPAIRAAVRAVFATANLRLVGLHSPTSVRGDLRRRRFRELAARRVIRLLRDVVEEFGVAKTAQISTVDLGGGLGISYLPQDDPRRSLNWPPKLSAIVEAVRSRGAARAPVGGRTGPGDRRPGTITVYEVGTVRTWRSADRRVGVTSASTAA